MKLGVAMFATDYAIRPDELARACEERGFESVWFPEHTHIPASRRTPWPLGGDLPRDYWHTHDLFVSLMAASAAASVSSSNTIPSSLPRKSPLLTSSRTAVCSSVLVEGGMLRRWKITGRP